MAADTDGPGSSHEAARAHRRAAIELHQRSVDAALHRLPDRGLLDRELATHDAARSVVAVALHPGDDVDRSSQDALLDQAVRRIRSIVREPAGVHQVGELDLAVVIDGDRYVADTVARRIARAFEQPFSIGADDVIVDVGVGSAEVDPRDPTDAVHRADLAARRPTS